jgi:small subunit ribosomal protein S6
VAGKIDTAGGLPCMVYETRSRGRRPLKSEGRFLFMRRYEYLYILDPKEETVRASIDAIKDQYESMGVNVTKEEEMGKRRLAYEIGGQTDGFYYATQIEVDDITKLQEYENDMKLNPDIIRFMKVTLS